MNKMLKLFSICGSLFLYVLLIPISFFFYKKHIWIVSERGDDARDNGYFFFKYLNEKHSDINSYFVINNKSVDYIKVNQLGKVIKPGSLKHWIYYIAADVRATTHLGACAPTKWIGRYFELHKAKHGINVFLQHGIIKEYLDMAIYKENHVDVFICGAKPEYDFLVKEYPAPEGTFYYTGLARFDNLHDFKTKRQILIMPTWRLYLSGLSKEDFSKSIYCQKWNEVLQDKALEELLVKNDINLIFYPHYSSQPYLDCFKSSNKNISIASFDNYDVSTLLKESALIITDYSSIFFDAAYMKKPLIYYQFDQQDYFSKHYHRGYFIHEKDGFGPVVYNKESLVKDISFYINNNFDNRKIYNERRNVFFKYDDCNNCERIYNVCFEKLRSK